MLAKTTIIVAGVLALLCLGLHTGLMIYWSKTMPHEPILELGRVYPLNNHGTIVYLTKQEDFQLLLVSLSGIVLFGIGATLNLIFKKF